ncbi:MAG: hypothetical protein MZV63_64400 [Marinilabiliales bacterium]|nr:hypothetical protein [Marinilabiliales bacterium]
MPLIVDATVRHAGPDAADRPRRRHRRPLADQDPSPRAASAVGGALISAQAASRPRS